MAIMHSFVTTTTTFNNPHTTELVTKIPERFPNDLDLFIGYFRAYVIGVLIVFGLIGNGLSAVVFYRRRNKEDGWTWYLFWLAISDTGCLLSSGLPEWMSQGLYFVTNKEVFIPVLTFSDISCRALRRRRLALLGILATSLIMWTTGPITHEVVEDNSPMKACVYDLTKLPLWLIIIFMTEAHLVHTLSSFIIMLSGIFLIIGIQRSRDAVTTTNQSGAKTRRAEMRCLINLIALTINFIIFIGPNVITWLIYINQYYSYGTVEPEVASVAWLTTSLVQGNYSLNVVLYMCFLPFFREELAMVVCDQCKWTTL